MPAWSLSGSLFMALIAPAVGEGAASLSKVKPAHSSTVVVRRDEYRMPVGRQPVTSVEDIQPTLSTYHRDWAPGPAFVRRVAVAVVPVVDPGNESVRQLLRDRKAKRGGALDARIEWRLSGAGSDLGLGGGLARIVGTLLHD